MNVCISGHSKEELAWAIDKWLQAIVMFVFLLLCKGYYCTVWLLIFVDIKFSWILLSFLSMIIYEFYTHAKTPSL